MASNARNSCPPCSCFPGLAQWTELYLLQHPGEYEERFDNVRMWSPGRICFDTVDEYGIFGRGDQYAHFPSGTSRNGIGNEGHNVVEKFRPVSTNY
ncbi:unnamed protein product [Allacma fusca]|uniref:Uncharacterized protein n=1 Tax=Allacma fusca TaxID=39272 RepID=A0A8J2NLZ9_9HEXA|nr:unnamed protein product [Allacma fusca]